MTHSEARDRAVAMLGDAGIVLTDAERESIEVADFGLGEFEQTGLTLLVYENNDRYCAKELVLFPHQRCPEHRHPRSATIRGRRRRSVARGRGDALGGRPRRADTAAGRPVHDPARHAAPVRAGDDGAIVSEFSSRSRDENDVFTDPKIVR